MSIELRKTVCNRDCPDACGIVATVENGRVTKLAGDPDHPVTKGYLCFRTGNFLRLQYGPDRITQPLLRKNGSFTPIPWKDALDLAAEKLLTIRKESGPASIFHYRSGGSLGLLTTLTDFFFEQFGPVTMKRGDICSGAGDAAQELDFGYEDSHDLFDLLNAKNIILWGKNVFTSSVHTIPVLRQARERGAHLMLIDPVHHKTASICDSYLQNRPGSDFALAMGIARILFEQNWIDPDAPRYCDHLDEFRALAMRKSIADWASETDLPPDSLFDLARRFGPGKPTAILVGWGMGRRVNGAGIVRAIDALCAISGNVGIPGGGVSFYFKRRGAFDQSFVRGIEAAPRTICEPLFGPDLLAAKDPAVRAVWITAGNPVAMLPESETTKRALETREFVVVVDPFLTDTARLAHLVLPTTTLLEADDLVGAYGHHWLGVARPVVAPPEGVKTDLEIMQELAKRTGLESVMAGTARQWKERMVAPKLAPHGVTLEKIENGYVRNPLAPPVLFADRKFPTATGRMNLLTEAPPVAERATGYPLTLMALSTPKAQSSQWTETPPDGPVVATVHPETAPGLAEDSTCRLESRIGSMNVRIRFDKNQRRDVVLLPKGGHLKDGRCANVLVRARTTDLGEGGALYDEPVRLVK